MPRRRRGINNCCRKGAIGFGARFSPSYGLPASNEPSTKASMLARYEIGELIYTIETDSCRLYCLVARNPRPPIESCPLLVASQVPCSDPLPPPPLNSEALTPLPDGT